METDRIAAVWGRVREREPLVHCLTNHVVKNFTANALLAVGAAPAMVEHPTEAEEFAGMADALLINLGTLDEGFKSAAVKAVSSARAAGKPWVLDPVAIGVLSVRTDFARQLLSSRPPFIRGNASEILALAGEVGQGRGVDAGDAAEAAIPAAKSLARRCDTTVLVTGPTDYFTDGEDVYSCSNGHPLLTRVTGVGCVQGALLAACAAVCDSGLEAAAAAALVMAIAGEIAAEKSTWPGSFQVALLDALDAVDGAILRERAKLNRYSTRD